MSCTGDRSGLTAPAVTTLVVDPKDPKNTAVVVTPTCSETKIEKVPSEERSEFRITANNMSIGAVASCPSVQSLFLVDNMVSKFDVGDTALYEIDLTNNQLTSLDKITLPSTLKRLILDFNPLKKISAGQLPANLQEFFLRKANIQSLAGFVFPSQITRLVLAGNRQLTSLYGLVLPTSLITLDISDSAVAEIGGVVFPKTLRQLIVSGTTPLSTFDFRASDLAVLSKVQIQASTVLTCPDPRGTITVITPGVSGCQYSDVDFAAKYPPIVTPTSSAPSPTVRSDANGSPSAATPVVTPSSGGSGGGSNSSQTIIVGVLVLVAVLVGATIGFIFQRRRKARRSEQEGNSPARKGSKSRTRTDEDTGGHAMLDLMTQPNSNGFLENDVRNDEALIAHRLPQDGIVIVSKIAQGGFGVVYKAKLYSQDVVVKQITPNKAESTEAVKRFMDEIRLYSKLDHTKIVRFVGVSWTNLFDLSLVMEYMPNGDLHTLLHTTAKDPSAKEQFSWFNDHAEPRCKAFLATDVAEALVYLHSYSPPIIHRDLKAKNVMLAADYTAKLGDFGISRVSAEETMTGGMGTTAWIAPEVLQGERYSEKADIYSFGILMCEMDSCDHPYSSSRTGDESLTDAKIAYLVSTASLKPRLQDNCPGAIEKLIFECLDFDPAKRPTAIELHYNLRKVREAALEWGFV